MGLAFHLDEPWDSEHNKKLIPRLPAVIEAAGRLLAAIAQEHQRISLRLASAKGPLARPAADVRAAVVDHGAMIEAMPEAKGKFGEEYPFAGSDGVHPDESGPLRELHLLTYSGCPIDQLTSMVTRLWNTTQPYRRAYVALSGPGRRWVINAEHRLLLDAIARRDSTDAQHCVSAHIRRTRVELERHPEIFGAPPG